MKPSDLFPLEYQVVSMYITVIPFAQHDFAGLQVSSGSIRLTGFRCDRCQVVCF